MKSQTEGDQLDIIHCAFLRQPYFRKNPAYIYGIAGSYNEALDMVVDLTNKAIDAGCEGRIVDYLESKASN